MANDFSTACGELSRVRADCQSALSGLSANLSLWLHLQAVLDAALGHLWHRAPANHRDTERTICPSLLPSLAMVRKSLAINASVASTASIRIAWAFRFRISIK
jgi:hypothetical protein